MRNYFDDKVWIYELVFDDIVVQSREKESAYEELQ